MLLLASPTLYAQNYLQKAIEYLDAGDCDMAKLAYDNYKLEHPQGNAEVAQRIEECGKVKPPTVFTLEPTSITSTSVTFRSYVLDDGGDGRDVITARGVCWSTAHQPTLNDNVVDFGTGTEIRFKQISGLKEGTTYYVRAYATNAAGTSYGEEVSFTTLSRPSVKTVGVEKSTATSATCGGNVTKDGGASVTARGVCWSTSRYPSIYDKYTSNGSGTGRYISTLSGLKAGTTYYVRAYATNEAGTSYGEEVSFTTKSIDDCGTVTDYDGNVYSTVVIGNQCWMKENLRTTHYADGTYIARGSNESYTTGYWYYPYDNSANKSTYGLLYNWKAVMRNASSSSSNPSRVQGICPRGWHVPSDAEWTQLTDYVGSQSQYKCGNSKDNIAKALASKTGWESSSDQCDVGNNPSANNATGFSALPAGCYGGGYYFFGYGAYFWSATEYGDRYAYYRLLVYGTADVYRDNNNLKDYGFSVRCVRD
ncbi:MAG: hypothetical protein J5644_00075 [Bacteroidales bacterium]|nr:hypothetical protein [Bacteroidales bacterium]